MKLLEDKENIVMFPLTWLSREVIPIPGYQETNGWRAFRAFHSITDDLWFHEYAIPIWEDWKLLQDTRMISK